MYSSTEQHLRTFVDKLTTALVDEFEVDVVPGDFWMAAPDATPPRLTYRTADVGVLGEQILTVTAHEIGHLLFTESVPGEKIEWPFDISKKPRAALLMFNAVEDIRVERRMSELYAGCRSLFDASNGESPPVGTWSSKKTREGFVDLPAKWRFILNIQRMGNGMEPLGTDHDRDAVQGIIKHVRAAVAKNTAKGCVGHLEPVYDALLAVMRRERAEKEAERRRKEKEEELKRQQEQGNPISQPGGIQAPDTRPDQMKDDPEGDEPSQSDGQTPMAQQDDGQPGGEDGSSGQREDGVGEGSAGTDGPEGDGDEGDDEESDTGSIHAGGDGKGSGVEGMYGEGEESWSEGAPDQTPDDDDEEPLSKGDSVKTGSLFQELVSEVDPEQGGVIVKNFKGYYDGLAREAKRLDREIQAEKEEHMARLAEGIGSTRKTSRIRRVMAENGPLYNELRASLETEIHTLRSYALGVLRENAYERFGGNFESGRRIKKHRLHRIATGDPRLFEKKQEVGGRSYAIGITVDQSSSMGNNKYYQRYGGYSANSAQSLAWASAVVIGEALDGLVDTAITGWYKDHNRYWNTGEGTSVFYYKRPDEPIEVVRPLIAEMRHSEGSTPMAEGLDATLELIKETDATNKAIILITDGAPDDQTLAHAAMIKAARLDIPVYALAIHGTTPVLEEGCRYVAEVYNPNEIPPATLHLLRMIVRREQVAA